jgi:hypothetical protein
MTINQHLELLSEIEKIPSESIPDLLQIVRFFRQNQEVKTTSLNAWNNSINKLDNQSKNNQKKIQELFDSWIELDDEKEQIETLKIIESLENISI